MQGLAGGVGIVIAQAAGRDIYEGTALIRLYGRLTVMGGLAAVAGPLVGGALTTVMDWRGLFLVLSGIGVAILLAVALGFTETLATDDRTAGGFDLTLPLEEAAEGYKAMDERRATKVMLTF